MIDVTKLVGAIIRFNPDIYEMESYAEPNMQARIISVTNEDVNDPDINNHVYRIRISYAEFEDHNVPFETSDYYDKSGNPCLTARQAGFYSVKDTLYFPSPELVAWDKYFQVIE